MRVPLSLLLDRRAGSSELPSPMSPHGKHMPWPRLACTRSTPVQKRARHDCLMSVVWSSCVERYVYTCVWCVLPVLEHVRSEPPRTRRELSQESSMLDGTFSVELNTEGEGEEDYDSDYDSDVSAGMCGCVIP